MNGLLAGKSVQFPAGAAGQAWCSDELRMQNSHLRGARCLACGPAVAHIGSPMQVMHHISSVSRRLALLAELGRVLRPSGRALVTVWATQQEEPDKIAKWQPIVQRASSHEDPATQQRPGSDRHAAKHAHPAGEVGGLPAGPNDYFVPWHLPIHRAEAAAAAAGATDADVVGREGCSGDACVPAPVLDRAKGTVVFKRFYHLFEADELRILALQLKGVMVLDLFYDKSNWCMIIERT